MSTRQVILHAAEEGGYWVDVPSLPGCISEGETREEALKNIAEAIALYIETLLDAGQDVPEDDPAPITVETVTV